MMKEMIRKVMECASYGTVKLQRRNRQGPSSDKREKEQGG